MKIKAFGKLTIIVLACARLRITTVIQNQRQPQRYINDSVRFGSKGERRENAKGNERVR